jgi:hypothetical protein
VIQSLLAPLRTTYALASAMKNINTEMMTTATPV